MTMPSRPFVRLLASAFLVFAGALAALADTTPLPAEFPSPQATGQAGVPLPPPAPPVGGPRRLASFEALMQALESGRRVRAVFHFKRCTLIADDGTQGPGPDAVGGMPIDDFEYFGRMCLGNPRAFVAFSKNVFVEHPSHGLIYNYVKARAAEDGSVRIQARFLDAKTLEPVMAETFVTTFEAGDGAGGASFFALD